MADPTIARALRADAQRNRAAIIDAAATCLTDDPRASMSQIAKTAGVGRVTLYGHFSSREVLIDTMVKLAMRQAEAQLSSLKLDGNPAAALELLVKSSWHLLVKSQAVLAAAEQELKSNRIRDHHDETMVRVHRLIERGQSDGTFRTNQSSGWLTTCFFALLHGAASEIRSGRLTEVDAGEAVCSSILHVMLERPTAYASRERATPRLRSGHV